MMTTEIGAGWDEFSSSIILVWLLWIQCYEFVIGGSNEGQVVLQGAGKFPCMLGVYSRRPRKRIVSIKVPTHF